MLGLAALKELVYAGKALGDVLGAGNAACMEGAHGKLGAGLADGLGGDNAHGLAHLHRLAVCKGAAVAALAHAVLGPAAEHGAYLNALGAPVYYGVGVPVVHKLIP